MRKIFIFICLALSFITIISCNDQVNPKTDFKEVYALNCIIRGDTSFQVATISHSYDVNGFDPSTNTMDPFIKGATVKLTYQNFDKVLYFRDTVLPRINNSRYSTPMNCYYLKNFQPIYDSPITIEATLPNEKFLKASTTTFYVSPYIFSNEEYTIPSAAIGGEFYINWNNEWNSRGETVYFVPELIIKYSKIENGIPVEYQKKVPYRYIPVDNGEYAIYPQIQAGIQSITFDLSTINKAMEEISRGDTNKQNYIIQKAVFRLIIADKNLAIYYAAQKSFLDEFSVRVVQLDYTNINGGLGVFGTLNSSQKDVEIKENYIKSFGYRAY